MQNGIFAPENLTKFWRFSFCLYAVLALTSMAGMGLGSGVFVLATLLMLVADWRGETGRAFRFLCGGAYLKLTLFLFVASALSLIAVVLAPPLGVPHPMSFAELKKFHYFLTPIFLALAFVGFGSVTKSPYWRFWEGMALFLGVLAVLQFWAGALFPEAWLDWRIFREAGTTGRFHAQGLMMFHLSFASAFTFVASALAARVLWPLGSDSRGRRLWFLFLSVLSAVAVFYTYSRIAWVGLALLYVILGFLKKPKWGLLALPVMAALASAVWLGSDTMRKRWEDSAAGIEERTAVWQSSWAMFTDRPVTGVGLGRTGFYSELYGKKVFGHEPKFASHAHNNFLEVLGGLGLFGFSAFLGWWGWLLWTAWRVFRESRAEERWLPAAALAGFFAFHVNGLTQVNFWDGKTQHTLFLWVGVVLALAAERNLRRS